MNNYVDFNNVEKVKRVFYGGDAGAKFAIKYNNEVWMLKLPKSTRDYKTRQVSYTTSPLSEYLGSQIYASLGIPVHETLLGERDGRVVVACKDFTRKKGVEIARLVPFNELKNAYMSSDIDSYSGTGSETLLEEVLDTISGQEDLRGIKGTLRRFWDMFVADAFIGKNDRNNGNWRLLHNFASDCMSLAPVYGNGNAFFNKRSATQMEKRLTNIDLLREDSYKTLTCAFKYIGYDNEAHKINPYTFINRRENEDCNAAVERFVERANMDKINQIIAHIPEKVGDITVMPQAQKEFYKAIMRIRYDEVILPTVTEIKKVKVSSLTKESHDARGASKALGIDGLGNMERNRDDGKEER